MDEANLKDKHGPLYNKKKLHAATRTVSAESGNKFILQELFKLHSWKWNKHARHLLVRLN